MATGSGLGGQMPVSSGITGSTRVGTGGPTSQFASPVVGQGPTGFDNTGMGYGSAPVSGTSMMGPAIQTIWSKEILFQAMPVLRFEQFAVKKTELGVMPGLVVNFMRYNNLPIPDGPLVEGIRMKTHAITANQYSITVAEQGFGVAVSELLLNASFDDIMASASRLLGRNMALFMDTQARQTLQRASSVVFGRTLPGAGALTGGYGIYNPGTISAAGAFHPHSVKDAVEVLSSKNIPRLGETYVCFAHPHQTRALRDTPEWIEVTKYAAPGNFMLGEIGRLNDVVFIETTQIGAPLAAAAPTGAPPVNPRVKDGLGAEWLASLASGANAAGQLDDQSDPIGQLNRRVFINITAAAATATGVPQGVYVAGAGGAVALAPATTVVHKGDVWVDGTTGVTHVATATAAAGVPVIGSFSNVIGTVAAAPNTGDVPGITNMPGWGEPWISDTGSYEAIMLGDNAFGHAVSLPVELRDGGVLDFGREHALAWYSIWGWGLVTESAVCKIQTG